MNQPKEVANSKQKTQKCKRCNKNQITINEFCDKCFRRIFEKKIINVLFKMPFSEVIFYDNIDMIKIINFYLDKNKDKIKYIIKSKKERSNQFNEQNELIFLSRNDFILLYFNLMTNKDNLIKIELNNQNKINVAINDNYKFKHNYFSPFEKITEKEISYFSQRFLKDCSYNLNDLKENLNLFCENLSYFENKNEIPVFKEINKKGFNKIIANLEKTNEESLYSFIASIDNIRNLL